jgi:hypothetical protein
MILLVIKITLSVSLVNMKNNKQIKLVKKNSCKLHARIHALCIQIQPKNLTSSDKAYRRGTSSKVNGPQVNHLKSLGTQKCSLRVDGPR